MTGVKMQSAIAKTADIDHRSFIKNPAEPRQPLLPLGRVEGILRHGSTHCVWRDCKNRDAVRLGLGCQTFGKTDERRLAGPSLD
jgi:hypothetical protein